jgi:hypothetical protein
MFEDLLFLIPAVFEHVILDVAYGIGAIKRNVKNGCFAWVTFLKKVYDTVIRVLS